MRIWVVLVFIVCTYLLLWAGEECIPVLMLRPWLEVYRVTLELCVLVMHPTNHKLYARRRP